MNASLLSIMRECCFQRLMSLLEFNEIIAS